MPLSARQQISFNHLTDLYRPIDDKATDGKVLPRRWVLAYSGVRCRFQMRPAISTATDAGRAEADISDSVDLLHVAEDQEVNDSWWAQNKSLNVDGTPAPFYDEWWYIRGEPVRYIHTPNRNSGKRALAASRESRAPLGIGT